jgi:hypothetical protein
VSWRTKAAGLAATGLITAGLVVAGSAGARAATTQLCQSQTTSVSGGTYTVQNNEWGSSAPECITTDGSADFRVANSSISNATNGAPGGYPSIYQGCHWGNCTSGGLSGNPVQASAITAGKVTTSWSTTQPGTGAYDVAYDIWFNQAPTTSGQPNGTELMIWLNHNGPVQPFGSQVATGTTIGGRGYNVWFGTQGWNTVSYTMTTAATSVSGLDLAPIVADAMNRGYIQPSWWLIDIEAGFELWQGGAGLATNSFSVSVNGSTPTPAACSATYSVLNSWPGSYQGQVVVKDTGTSPKNGWKVAWTFPGNQQITTLFNGAYTQSGQQVTVSNVSYNASIPAGGSVNFGFIANVTGTNAAPASITCS